MMKKNPVMLMGLVAIGLFIMNIIVYSVTLTGGLVDSAEFMHYSTLVIVTCAAITVANFGLTLKAFGLKTPPGKVWLCLLIGFALWLVGEIIWWEVYAVEGLDPFPSTADYFWVVGYPVIILGVLLQMRLAKVQIPSKEKIAVLVVTLVIAVISIIFIIYPIAVEPITIAFTAEMQFYQLIYPTLDLVLIPTALLLVFKYRGGAFSKAWLIISVGLIINAAFDLLFSYADWQCALTVEAIFCDAYLLLDHVYIGYYLIVALGATFLRQALKNPA